MCFSATASFAASGVLTATGGATIYSARGRKRLLPLATIPLIFGIQQGIEGVVWISLMHETRSEVATYAYLFFSHVLWPVFVPVAVLLVEPDRLRGGILYLVSAIGGGVSIHLLDFLRTQAIYPREVGESIVYYSPTQHSLVTLGLYVLATCGGCLVSSHRMIACLGLALFAAYIVSIVFYMEAFFSIWCFLSAILSIVVFWFVSSDRSSSTRLRAA